MRLHYWKRDLCRVQTALPSVKNQAHGKELHSAKSSLPSAGHSAKKALGKGLLCRVPGSQQKLGTRHRLPHITVFGHVLLCRVAAVRHSAKIFFLENTLSSAPDTALGKDFFFRNVFAEFPCEGTRQRENFLKKFKTIFAECLILGTRHRPPLPSAIPWHSAIFFVFGLQIFCAALLKYQELLVRIWGIFVAF